MKAGMIIAGLCCLILSGTVSADEIGVVTLQNKAQVAVATGIFAGAAARTGDNGFVVVATPQQRMLAARSGLSYVPLFENVADPSAFFILSSDRRKGPEFSVASLGQATALSDNRYLAEIGQSTASLLSRDASVWTTPVTNADIGFVYRAPTSLSYVLDQLDFPTDSLADLINIDSMAYYVQRLEAFRTRYIYTDSNTAAIDWLVQKFLAWGYTDVTLPTFVYNSTVLENVKVIKQGYAEPDKVIVIGGHFDSITYGQPTTASQYAPGADDNATGTAMTLELARILANIPTRKTIVFMPFNAEEVGLVGSRAAARDFRTAGTNLEVMLNWDMVAHDDMGLRRLDVASSRSPLWQVAASAAARVSNIAIVNAAMGSSSDHAGFLEQGFDVIDHIENDFNYAGWHTDYDHFDSLNMPFYENVGRMAAATVGVVVNAASPGVIESIVDIGNGSQLEVFFEDCEPDYTYRLRYGTVTGGYTDSLDVPPGDCSAVVSGLTDGQLYFFSVIGQTPEGYGSLYTTESSEMPLVIPRVPATVTAEPQSNQIVIDWAYGIESDIAYYNLYRRIAALPQTTLYQGGLTDTTFTDVNVSRGVEYVYTVTAVDNDFNESAPSLEVAAIPATFDGGLLLADECNDGTGLPAQPAQEAWFDTLFNDLAHYVWPINSSATSLTRNLLGQYSSVFYLDDDFVEKYWTTNRDTVTWYLAHQTNMLIGGWGVVWNAGASPVPAGSLFNSEFGITAYESSYTNDFIGAFGQNGWPSVTVDPSRGPVRLGMIQRLSTAPGAEVIYTWDSYTNNASFEGQPCGVAVDGPNGKRVYLGFPLWNMHPAEARAVIQKAAAWFGETTTMSTNGDLNGDGVVTLTDLTLLVQYLFITYQPPTHRNGADANGDCKVTLTDVSFLVNYMFSSGEAPRPGCVE